MPGQGPRKRSLFTQKNNSGSNEQSNGSVIRLLIPPRSFFSIIILTVLYPLLILSAVSLLEPIIDYFLLFLPFAEHTQVAQLTAIPWLAFLKLLFFLPLAILSFGLTLFKLTTEYHLAWSKQLPQAHPNHCAFTPGRQVSSFALLKWEIYKWGKILIQPLLFSILISGLLLAMLWLLQLFQKSYTLIFEILFVVVFFALITTSFYTLLSLLRAGRLFLTTNLGSTASILEPKQPAKIIFERVQRLYAYSGWQWFILLQELLVYATISFSIWYMSSHFAVNQLYSFNFNLLKLFFLGFTLLVQYIVLLGCKFYTYSDALNNYYETLFG